LSEAHARRSRTGPLVHSHRERAIKRFQNLGATLAAAAFLASCQRSTTTKQEIEILTDGNKTPAVNEVPPAKTGSAPTSLPSVIVADRYAFGKPESSRYNPIEGTVFQGDIWRVKNGAPAIWVNADTAANCNDDRKDAGDIGSGHQVTALYEVVPIGVEMTSTAGVVDPLKHQRPASDELLTIRLRYKQPDGDTRRLLEVPVHDKGSSLMDCSDDFIFAASVAGFGMHLRQSKQTDLMTLGQIKELADSTRGADKDGRRAEFVRLVERTIELAAAK
jgi:hypothetical protein